MFVKWLPISEQIKIETVITIKIIYITFVSKYDVIKSIWFIDHFLLYNPIDKFTYIHCQTIINPVEHKMYI